MPDPRIIITLDGRGRRQYQPGETLAGSYFFDSVSAEEILAIECSVFWYTTGKGSEDMGIHAFWRYAVDAGDWIDPRSRGRFSTALPRDPLSYRGIIVKIHWAVRVRAFLTDAREITEDFSFRLGSLHDVRTMRSVHAYPSLY
ncbi:MAG: hypothetical protein LBH00_07405 [Planctomycetaceae bacterium]|jgi:hypothetical protein|nr:hypothetical protein [Planctomycetaceae bacterium]